MLSNPNDESPANVDAGVSATLYVGFMKVNSSPSTPLLIFMHDVIILAKNEAIGAHLPPLAVAAPMTSFWARIVTYSCINIKRGVFSQPPPLSPPLPSPYDIKKYTNE